ncbi:MAG: NFACT family protein [Clostridiales bacterium]|jgi:predicted ribosome quality control (RQC) complex YloA/Tae2 family protein|nr:NFACT family protein [Clostridiales bacterium]
MPNDLVTLKVLVGELNDILSGGKIDRITQPEKDGIVLSVRNNSSNFSLFISCAPDCPRIHLTRQKRENPLNAPSFCMLLRKHLEKSSILSVDLLGGDRIISLSCLGRNELFDLTKCRLTLELMSRHSNIFLTDENDKILGAVKQTFLNESERLILPGARYSPPQNNKIRLDDTDGIRALLLGKRGGDPAFLNADGADAPPRKIGGISVLSIENKSGSQAAAEQKNDPSIPSFKDGNSLNLSGHKSADTSVLSIENKSGSKAAAERKNDPSIPSFKDENSLTPPPFLRFAARQKEGIPFFLAGNISGLSKETAREIAWRAGLDCAEFPISEKEAENIISVIKDFDFSSSKSLSDKDGAKECFHIGKSPCLAFKNGIPIDFFITEYSSIDAVYKPFDLLNSAADEFYSEKERADLIKRKAKSLSDILKKAVVKTEKKLADNRDGLSKCENAENLKKFGNLILNNIYLVKNKSQNLDALDYESGETLKIPLDKNLSPSENAAAYFKKYAKLKRTEENVKKNLEQNSLFLEYLLSIENGIALSENAAELAEIENELIEIGLIKTSAKNIKNAKNPKKNKNFKPADRKKTTAANVGCYRCEIDGYKIYAGKNNAQNDYVTFSLAKNGDIWLHAKNYHGAHVIISADSNKNFDPISKISTSGNAKMQNSNNNYNSTSKFPVRENTKNADLNKNFNQISKISTSGNAKMQNLNDNYNSTSKFPVRENTKNADLNKNFNQISKISVPEHILTAAAGIAAYFSKARQAAKVQVDYTERRNVKKIPAAGKGMVTYSDFKTISAEPKLIEP